MPPLDPYLSPPAQQALIAGLFLAAGWWVVAFQNRWRDAKLRSERIIDMQRALLAEIRAHVVSLEYQLQEGDPRQLVTRVREGDAAVVLTHRGNDQFYRAIICDIHVLPGSVIDPVVIYYRLIAVMGALADSIRRAARNNPDRAAEMMLDYLALNGEAWEAGMDALEYLTASLRGGDAEVLAMQLRHTEESGRQIRANLPGELAEMRDRLSKRSLDRSDL